MQIMDGPFTILPAIQGVSGHRPVLLGFAPASILARLSFADILDEDVGVGYQRRFNEKHSREFSRYIADAPATTIPVTLNARVGTGCNWEVREQLGGLVQFLIEENGRKALAQVDGQHRLGHLENSQVSLAFMLYLGLSLTEEIELFRTINTKAKGLPGSLTSFHQSKLDEDYRSHNPALYIAIQLNRLEQSPWQKRLDSGGKRGVQGRMRIATLRTMELALKRMLVSRAEFKSMDADQWVHALIAFWQAVGNVVPAEWSNTRAHILVKGIGVYSLTGLAADLVSDVLQRDSISPVDLEAKLAFLKTIDWTNTGPFKGYGGEGGAGAALEMLRSLRNRAASTDMLDGAVHA
jgi:DGQHR domain-containing protein